MNVEQLEHAIATVETHRALLGDTVVNALTDLIREKLALLAAQQLAVTAQQRKQVTILFADVSGFTAMAEVMDAEDVAELINALWQRIDIAILSQGGMIDKHIGDAVMALWGGQTTREDDPTGWAVQAALAIQSALATFHEQIGTQQDERRPDLAHRRAALQIRIGINTGPVLLGAVGTMGEFTAMGDTVNVASRLEHAAPVGGILISRDTYHHIRGLFDVQTLDPLVVKGKHDPLPVYRVLRSRPRAFRVFARGIEGIETPMIGRESELRQLQGAFQQVTRRTEAQLAIVLGEAGMGKSRLLYEFNHWLDLQPELGYILKGRASQSTQHVPYALLRDLLLSWLRIQEHTGAANVLAGLEQGFAALLGRAGVEAAHFIGHLIGLDVIDSPFLVGIRDDTRQIRNRAIHALARLLMAAQHDSRRTSAHAAGGAVIMLDDLHWADTSSLEVFAELLQICRQAPILMICGARPTVSTHAPDWRNALPLQMVLRLDLLSDEAVAQLVSGLLRHSPDVPLALHQMIVNAAEGNPFYVEELIKMLIEDGVIRFEDDGYLIALERLPHVRVPPTLTGVLQARLDGLTPDEHEVIHCAAVIGRIFWDGAIAMLAQDEAPTESRSDSHTTVMAFDLPACLDALQHKEMIFRRPTSAFAGTCEYIFKHTLLRDVAYEQVLRRRRRIYHARAARWLEAVTQQNGQADAHAALIADHYDQAGMAIEAATWYTRAGARAAAQFANAEALAHFNRALALVPKASLTAHYALVLAREQVYDLQGVRPAQQRDLEELAALAEALDDDWRRAEVALRLANFVEVIGDSLTAAVAAQQAIELARSVNAVESEAAAYLVWGRALWHQAAYTAAETQLAQCLALARSAGLHRLEADSLHYLGTIALEEGDHRSAQTHFEAALSRFHTIGDRRSESTVLNKQGMVAAHQGDFTGARAVWERALGLFREVGDRRSEGAALQNLGLAAASRGDYGEARAMLDQALHCCRETGDRYGESSVLGNLGNIARAQGDYAHARDYLMSALHLDSYIGDRERAGWALIYLSLLCHSTRENVAAFDYSRQALRIAQELGTRRLQARALTQSGHNLWRVGHLDEAANAYGQALTIQRGLGAHNLAMEPLAGLAQVALDRGDVEMARAYAEEILSYLALITLDGAEEPLRVYLTCYQVLHAMHDPRADALLDKAHRVLHGQASRIGDPTQRRSFLENVPIHRTLELAWAAYHNHT